jgi:hypothetical protein
MHRCCRRAWRSVRGWGAIGALLATYSMASLSSGCSGRRGPQVGGETHWLAACAEDTECGATGLTCVCGTCTRICSSDATCGDASEAACFNANSPLLLQRCEDRSSSRATGICLPRCTQNAECGSTRLCLQGACIPSLPSDAGTQTTEAGLTKPRIADFAAVDASVPWTSAVVAPVPQASIEGGDDRILGTWRQSDCADSAVRDAYGCMRLVIERTAGGAVEGGVNFDAFEGALNQSERFPGPFLPALDPDQGYPTEVAVEHYADLVSNPQEHVPYRILDGRLTDNRLTFTWTTADIWHSWCQLQRPFLWEVGGHQFYFCVPQGDEAQSTIAEGKIVLCTSADFFPLCDDGMGNRTPCVCTSPDHYARCSIAYCRCDSGSCDAALHSLADQVELTLTNGQLVGAWIATGLRNEKLTFERISP